MSFNNPTFSDWYTDTADIYRVVPVKNGNITSQERQKVNPAPIPCRIYSSSGESPNMTSNAARIRTSEKMACDLTADIRAGDEIWIIRGGKLGRMSQPERYFAGDPHSYYDPVGGTLTGLEHKEIGLLKENVIQGGM